MNCFRFFILCFLVIFASSFNNLAQAEKYSNTVETFKKSSAVQPFFKSAYGYAVFPTVGKAGFGIGGAYGSGQVYRRGKVTGTAKLFKGTIGFQFGGQAFSEIIFFEDKRAYNDFTSGNFEFDAAASAVAITAGVQAKAALFTDRQAKINRFAWYQRQQSASGLSSQLRRGNFENESKPTRCEMDGKHSCW